MAGVGVSGLCPGDNSPSRRLNTQKKKFCLLLLSWNIAVFSLVINEAAPIPENILSITRRDDLRLSGHASAFPSAQGVLARRSGEDRQQ